MRTMNALISEKHAEIIALCRRFRVKALELFGSATGDRFDPATSDLDFLVDYEKISPSEHAACYFGLLFSLEELFGRDVDLVELSAVRNPFFLKAIAKDRVLLYAA
jgi:predicted nucleotidyltransferase